MLKLKSLTTAYKKAIKEQASVRPVFDNCHIKGSNFHLNGYVFDLSVQLPFMSSTVENDVLINLEQFSKFFDAKKGDVSVSNIGEEILLQHKNTKLKLPIHDVDSYPETVKDGSEFKEYKLPKNLLIKLEKSLKFATTGKNRHSLNSATIDFNNKALISTDQTQLRFEHLEIEGKGRVSIPRYIVPILKALSEPALTLKVFEEYSVLEGKNFQLKFKKLETNLPEYMSAVNSYENQGKFRKTTKEELKAVIEDLSLVSTEHNRNVEFTGHSFKFNTPKGSMETGTLGEKLEYSIGINLGLLENYQKTLEKNSELTIQTMGPKKPIIFNDAQGILFMSPCNLV